MKRETMKSLDKSLNFFMLIIDLVIFSMIVPIAAVGMFVIIGLSPFAGTFRGIVLWVISTAGISCLITLLSTLLILASQKSRGKHERKPSNN